MDPFDYPECPSVSICALSKCLTGVAMFFESLICLTVLFLGIHYMKSTDFRCDIFDQMNVTLWKVAVSSRRVFWDCLPHRRELLRLKYHKIIAHLSDPIEVATDTIFSSIDINRAMILKRRVRFSLVTRPLGLERGAWGIRIYQNLSQASIRLAWCSTPKSFIRMSTSITRAITKMASPEMVLKALQTLRVTNLSIIFSCFLF